MFKDDRSSSEYSSSSPQETPLPLALSLQTPAGVALIIFAALIAYLPALNGGFIWDDNVLLADNPLIKTADGLYRFWFTAEALDYWPMTYSTFWIEWRLWGISPTGYHVTNLILHIGTSLLIWVILRKLSIPGAFLAALIFVLHPVNVESVAWIAQRKNLLAMLFFLLSILCYFKFVFPSQPADAGRSPDDADRSPTVHCPPPTAHRPLFYWLSFGAFLLAMLSKGSIVVLPVLLLGIVWWQRKVTWRDIARLVPFFVVAAALAAVNVWFQTHGMGEEIRSAGFVERLLGASGVVWFYLYKALLPLNLIFVYPAWHIEVGNLLWWLPLLATVAVTIVFWRYRAGWSRPFLFAWVFFCVALVPVLGLTDVYFMKYSLVANHYQHIAIIGVIALAAAGWSKWRDHLQGPARWTSNALAIILLGILMLLSCRQSAMYRDEIMLYQATLEKNPGCWVAYYNLGLESARAGRLPKAIEYYQQALRLKPDYSEAHNNLGAALIQMGRPQEALEHLQKTLLHFPNSPGAHVNLGVALEKTGLPEDAINHYRQALQIKPNHIQAQYNLGNVLLKTGRSQEAIEHFQQALRLNPHNPEIYNNLGVALSQTGRPGEAIEYYQLALRLKPDFIEVYLNLASAYAKTSQSSAAVNAVQQALALARSKGKTAQAKQIEDWLNAYRDSLSK